MKLPYILAGTAAVLGAAAFVEHFNINTVHYQVCSEKIPESFDRLKIVQLSDLHATVHGKNNYRIIENIDEIKPDIILMTGDMTDERADINSFMALCRNLGKRYNTFYTFGNHELRLSDDDLMRIINCVRYSGVHFLSNDYFSLISGEDRIDIYGMWANLDYYKDEITGYRGAKPFKADDIRELIDKPNPHIFNILMAHNPQWLDTYAEWGADLVFSGHNHGGAVRVPYLGGVLSPERTFFPKYDLGVFTKKDTTMIVSGGIGGIRLFNRPQIVVTELRSK